jgi:hypothetical protein
MAIDSRISASVSAPTLIWLEAGGHLTTRQANGRFTLIAELPPEPLPVPSPMPLPSPMPAFGVPPACSGATGIVQRRIAALDAEITRLRDQLTARVMASSRVA